jgi:hypothetical protein
LVLFCWFKLYKSYFWCHNQVPKCCFPCLNHCTKIINSTLKSCWCLQHYMIIRCHVVCWDWVMSLVIGWNHDQLCGLTIFYWWNMKIVGRLNIFECPKIHLWTFVTRWDFWFQSMILGIKRQFLLTFTFLVQSIYLHMVQKS